MNAHVLVFDKLLYLDRLKSAGVPEEVARAHADGLDQALRESVATKSDVDTARGELEEAKRELKAEIGAVRSELKAEIGAVRTELKAEIEAVRTELKAEIEVVRTEFRASIETAKGELRAEIRAVKVELEARIDTVAARLETKIAEAQTATTRWMVGSFLAMTGVFWTLLKFAH